MAEAGSISGSGVLRRKVAAARAEVAAGGPGADRCWRLALARAARDKLKTTLEFRSLALDRRSLGELVDLAPDRALIAVLDGPAEGLGVIMLDPQVLAGFIEAQTIGKVKSTELAARKPTRTDAAMVAGLIDTALRGLEQALSEEADLVWAGGFRYASFLDDPRPLGLLLEDTSYRVLKAAVDLGGGARVGEILLALPAEGRGAGPTSRSGAGDEAEHGHAFMQALNERVNGAQGGLDAVLARLTLPLNDVLSLTEGALLALPQAGLDRISLEGLDGRRVAEGRLGQNRGMRAIRLNEAGAGQSGAGLAGSGHAGSGQSGLGKAGIGKAGLGQAGPDTGGADAFAAPEGFGMAPEPALGFDPGGFGSADEGDFAFPATGTG